MNSIERVRATVEGRPVDRRAFSMTLSLYGARLTTCDLHDYYTDPAAYARGQAAVREAFEPDVLLGPFVLPFLGEAFGSRVRFHEDSLPTLKTPAISAAGEIDRLATPNVETHPRLLYMRETVRRLATEHGRDVPVAAVALSPMDLPAMILGVGDWLQALLFDPEHARRVLDVTVPHFIQWMNALFADGATFVILPAAFVNSRIVTREIAQEIAAPALRAAFADVRGSIVLHHAGARMGAFLDLLAGLPNVVAFCIDGSDDPKEARGMIGAEPLLMTGPEGPRLLGRSAEGIRAECVAILRERRDDPRFILSTCAADIDMQTPPENIRAFREAVEAVREEDG